ncbi:hypothetical protein [Secundilactobacillus folii]|uniref:Mga helix-turn-helix domain-containing protein n=1 Tax=Secundilactobacillus folii TaxID=2678357 RepID=A0A7X2XZD3_9LACO|nr:hypothetical protein [Secundilactobacillus folii]MTV83136.1 hypothetical protein [Secundilactobacillus folii]
MIKDQDSQTAARQTQLTLWLLVHAPKHVPLTELGERVSADTETIRHDLNWISDFLAPYDLVVDPSVDQQVAILGRENNFFHATLDLLKTMTSSTKLITSFPIENAKLEAQLSDRLNGLVQTIPLELEAQQAIYDYMWTLAMRYRYGTVKRLPLAVFFTPGQLALIAREKEIHHWSQHTIEVLEGDLPAGHDMPLIEAYLLTLRVWLYSH